MSPWSRKPRCIGGKFNSHFFKPRGVPLTVLEIYQLNHDELEAIRLMDLEHLKQEDAAKSMGISRSTLQRILETAREKIALALINGGAIKVKDVEE